MRLWWAPVDLVVERTYRVAVPDQECRLSVLETTALPAQPLPLQEAHGDRQDGGRRERHDDEATCDVEVEPPGHRGDGSRQEDRSVEDPPELRGRVDRKRSS